MAWMIPIINNGRNRNGHRKISGLISILLLFLGFGIFFLSFFGFSKFDGFMIQTTWIIGGMIFLIFIFVVIGIVVAVASANAGKAKIQGLEQKPIQSQNQNPRVNPYIIRSPTQTRYKEPIEDKFEKVVPNYHEIQFCRYCGAKLEKDAKYCHECGIKIRI
ncbi:MAG: zinc ribbon domain-containing protein [Promethearchaeota archaeon]